MSEKPRSAPALKGKALIAVGLIFVLFFLWGLTMNLINALNSPMGNYLQLNGVETSLMQVAYWGAYFVMAIPASKITTRHGYKAGVLTGIALFTAGSFVTVPACNTANFPLFLVAMFVVAAGAATLETSCNPYVTKLGDEAHEEMRLNLAQGFNGIGNIVGPFIISAVIGATVAPGEAGFDAAKLAFLDGTRLIYVVIGIVMAVILAVFVFIKLPQPPGDAEDIDEKVGLGELFRHPHFALGILAMFIFIGLQIGGMAFFSSYALEQWPGLDAGMAATLLGILSVLFTLGRFATTPVVAKLRPHRVLGVYMLLAGLFMFFAFLGLGVASVICFMVAFFFVSIGYATIFSLTIKGFQGAAAKTGSSALVMSLLGGALIPLLLSAVGDAFGWTMACLVMVPGFVYVAWYAFKGSQIGLEKR